MSDCLIQVSDQSSKRSANYIWEALQQHFIPAHSGVAEHMDSPNGCPLTSLSTPARWFLTATGRERLFGAQRVFFQDSCLRHTLTHTTRPLQPLLLLYVLNRTLPYYTVCLSCGAALHADILPSAVVCVRLVYSPRPVTSCHPSIT